MWNAKAKPTRANLAKRLYAAEDALNSALKLLEQMPKEARIATAVRNAGAWITDAQQKLDARKGRRTA